MISAANCDLHTHTTYSDGRGSVEENVRGAEAAGLEAVAISDHFVPGEKEHSVYQEKLHQRLNEVQQARAWSGARVIMAVEATATDIQGHVSVAEPDLIGVELTLVDVGYETAGLAFAIPQGRSRQLDAIFSLYNRLAANPLVDVLAHPFTFGRFGLDITLDDVPDECLRELGTTLAARGAAFEINNGVWWWWPQFHPMQLAEAYARVVAAVADGGARFTLASDAHCNTGVGNLAWAQKVATLAGLNTNHWADVEQLLAQKAGALE